VSASAGVALFPRHGADIKTLALAADQALYRAKQAGKRRALLA
jgi:GGDEF domain-containing protein